MSVDSPTVIRELSPSPILSPADSPKNEDVHLLDEARNDTAQAESESDQSHALSDTLRPNSIISHSSPEQSSKPPDIASLEKGSIKATRDNNQDSFLRATGLKIISFVLRSWKHSPEKQEKKKVLIAKSRPLALARASVHLLPVSITVALIYVNLSGHILGPDLSGAATLILQVAAKLHVRQRIFVLSEQTYVLICT
jgi:hypothetical protein